MKTRGINPRLRRAARTRRIQADGARLCVHRTGRHIYAQLIGGDKKVLASASSAEAEMRAQLKNNGGNKAAAAAVGARIAEKAKAAGVARAAFDRGGLKYHGRVQALADAAREAGLAF